MREHKGLQSHYVWQQPPLPTNRLLIEVVEVVVEVEPQSATLVVQAFQEEHLAAVKKLAVVEGWVVHIQDVLSCYDPTVPLGCSLFRVVTVGP